MHPKVNAVKKIFDRCRTQTRPYISLNGAINSGPTAYARTYIDIVKPTTVGLVIP